MEASQMTLEEIDTIHNNFKEVIIRLINEGSKFEEVLYLARRFIRVNYYNCSTNMGTTWNMIYNWAKEYEKEKITIVIDPLGVAKKEYSKILNEIYSLKSLSTLLSERGERSNIKKEDKLLLFLDINHLHTYHELSQIKIFNRIAESYPNYFIDAHNPYKHSNTIRRYIKLAKDIKSITGVYHNEKPI